MSGFKCNVGAGKRIAGSPRIVTSGTASVDAVPDIATLAIEVNVAAKDGDGEEAEADEARGAISFLSPGKIRLRKRH